MASISRKSNTRLSNSRVGLRGGDCAFTNWWASTTTYGKSSNALGRTYEHVRRHDADHALPGNSEHPRREKNISKRKKTRNGEENNASKQAWTKTTYLLTKKIKIALRHLMRRRSKNKPPVCGNRMGSRHWIRVLHGEEEGVEDVGVRLEHQNMALNAMACNDGTT